MAKQHGGGVTRLRNTAHEETPSLRNQTCARKTPDKAAPTPETSGESLRGILISGDLEGPVAKRRFINWLIFRFRATGIGDFDSWGTVRPPNRAMYPPKVGLGNISAMLVWPTPPFGARRLSPLFTSLTRAAIASVNLSSLFAVKEKQWRSWLPFAVRVDCARVTHTPLRIKPIAMN